MTRAPDTEELAARLTRMKRLVEELERVRSDSADQLQAIKNLRADHERHATILLVDDNTTALKMYAKFLQPIGYRVLTAVDAPTALTLAERHNPDAVVLDLRLPDERDGLKVLRRLRTGCEHPPPVEIVTGDYALDPDIEHEIRAVGASITFKPLWLDDMLALVQRLLHSDR